MDGVNLLTIELLRWVARAPRSLGEARAAWRSTCPTTSAWEDAITADLVAFAGSGRRGEATAIVLTPRGRALLAAHETSGEAVDPHRVVVEERALLRGG
jgi:hypothetical protein